MRRNVLVTVWLCLMCLASTLASQEIPDFTEPFGNISSSDLVVDTDVPPDGLLLAVEERPKTIFFFVPSILDSEGSFISGLTAGAQFTTRTQVDIRYLSIGFDGASADLDQTRLRIKQSIKLPDQRFGLALIGSASETKDLRDDLGFSLASSYTIKRDAERYVDEVGFTINVGWKERTPEAGESVDDMGAGVGISFKIGSMKIAMDYTVEDDISESDNYSLAMQHAVSSSSKVGFGIAKDSVLFGSYAVSF